jgi:hypothetical protein
MEVLYGAEPAVFTGGPVDDLVSELEPTEGGLMAAILALETHETKRVARVSARVSATVQAGAHTRPLFSST